MLYYKIIGEGNPVVILHGLFGTSDNWRTFAGMLKNHFQVILIDQRNHGRSFWSDEFNYDVLSEDVIEVLDSLEIRQAHILGHSMGGKTALTLAKLFPERIASLMVIDIGVKQYAPGHNQIFDAILNMNPDDLSSRSEADEMLSKTIKDKSVRQFLLKSLGRTPEGGFKWKTNFQALYLQYEHILAALSVDNISVPSLFVRGIKSHYISNEDIEKLEKMFSSVRFVNINAGHWVHAERPKELFEAISSFLNDVSLE